MRVTEALKMIIIKEVVYWFAMACEEVKKSTLQKLWRKLLTVGVTRRVVMEQDNENCHYTNQISKFCLD